MINAGIQSASTTFQYNARQLPVRRIRNETHKNARNQTSNRHRNEPTKINPSHHAPVNRPPITITQTNTHNCTRDALRSRNRKLKTRRHNHSNHGTQLHRESTSRRHERHAVTQVTHNVVTICPQTNNDTNTTKRQNPRGDSGLLGNVAASPNLVDGGIGTNGVGDVVGAVGKGRGGGGHDLEEGVEEFSAVVEVASAGVDFLDVTRNNGLFALGADDVLVDTAENGPFHPPEEDVALVPGTVGLGTNDGLVGRHWLLVTVSRCLGGQDLLLVGVLALDVFVDGGGAAGTAGIELFLGQVSLVEVADNALEVLGGRGHFAAAQEEGTLEDVPAGKLPVFLDDDAVQPGDEEDSHEQTPGCAGGDDNTGDLGIGKFNLVVTTFPDEQHGDEGAREPEVDGDEDKTPRGGVGAQKHSILGEEEDDCAKGTREHRCNDPREEYLYHSLLDVDGPVLLVADPGYAVAAEGTDTHAQHAAEDGVRGGNGHAEAGGHGEVQRRSDDGADHAEHEQGGLVVKGGDVDDFGADGVGDAAAHAEGAGEFHDGGAEHGLDVSDGAGGDGGGPRVGDIVGADVPGVEEGEDGAYREEVVVLVEGHGHGVDSDRV